jgi:hypothetical protein
VGAAWANWAQGGGAPGAAGPAGVGPRRGRERKRGERKREKKERKDLLLIFEIRSFYMNAFALSKQSKEMQGSAWCIKQHKVFRVFSLHGNSKPNPARTFGKGQGLAREKEKEKVTPEFWRVKKRKKNSTAKFGALQPRSDNTPPPCTFHIRDLGK